MFLPLILACSCLTSFQDVKSEVNTQVYLLEKQIEHFSSVENYNPDFWYAKGKFDAYISMQTHFNLEDDDLITRVESEIEEQRASLVKSDIRH